MNNPKLEKELSKIDDVIASKERSVKVEYIRSRINKNSDAEIQKAEKTLEKNATVKENETVLAESVASKVGGTAVGIGAGAIVAGGLMILGNAINFGLGAAGGLVGVPLAIVITLISTLIVGGIVTLIVDKTSDDEF